MAYLAAGHVLVGLGIVGFILPVMPGVVFLIFTGMMVLQLIWVKMMVPETKGVPLEEMQRKLASPR